MDTINTFIENFSNAVDFQEPIEITASTQLQDMKEWDSLAALAVIVMFDMEYGKTITGNDLKNCISITDLHDLTI